MEIIQESGRSHLCVGYDGAEINYMVRMLTDNNITGSPQCRPGLYLNSEVLKYDITNMKSLRREYDSKPMHFEDLRWLLYGISQILTEAAGYLLDEEYYVYDPDYMFIDMEYGRLHMICIPYKCDENSTDGRYRRLADFILEKIEHKEEQAVSIAYQFYRMSKESLFSVIGFCSLIDKEGSRVRNGDNVRDGGLRTESRTADRADEGTIYGEDRDWEDWKKWDTDTPQAHTTDLRDKEKAQSSAAGIRNIAIAGVASVIMTMVHIFIGKGSLYALYTLLAVIAGVTATAVLAIRELAGRIRDKKDKELKSAMSARQVSVNEYWGTDEETVFFDEETQVFDGEEKETGCILEWNENGESRRESVKGSSILLGKKFDEVDVCISDPTVSRKHAKVMIRNGGIFLQDLGSTNGTYVDGRKLTPGEDIRLYDKRDFVLGKVQVRVV